MPKVRVSTVTTIRSSLADTLRFAAYHLALGIEEMFLFFDDPEDPAIEPLQDIPGVSCTRCDDAYWSRHPAESRTTLTRRQEANADLALARARKRGHDWILHLDGDELVYPQAGLDDILGDFDGDELRLGICEAVPRREPGESIFDASEFRSVPSRAQETIARALGCGGAFFGGRFFRGHARSKTAVRTSATISGMGVHAARWTPKREVTERSRQLLLLHFDGTGARSWKEKWTLRLERDAEKESWGPPRRAQFDLFKQALPAGEAAIREAHWRLYGLSTYQRAVLRGLRMLRRIEIDPRSFELPEVERPRRVGGRS